MSAETAKGGVDYTLSKGDVLMIPEKIAQTVSKVKGKLVLWSVAMLRPVPAATPAPPNPGAASPW
jgi:hypothetical protein